MIIQAQLIDFIVSNITNTIVLCEKKLLKVGGYCKNISADIAAHMNHLNFEPVQPHVL